MNLQQARANPHRSLIRQFTESAAYALLFSFSAASAHSPNTATEAKAEATVGAAADAGTFGNVALHTIRRRSIEEIPPPPANDEPVIVDFTEQPEGWDALPQTVITKKMRDIEKRANAMNPKYPVTILDDDTINLRRTYNIHTFRNRMYEVLNDRNISLRWNMKSDIATALGSMKGPTHRDPQAFRIDPDSYQESRNPLDGNVDQKHGCVVITSVPDLSSRSFINKWVGHKAGPNTMESKIDPGPYAMTLRTTWHEVWHCIDPHFLEGGYYVKGDPALDNAQRMHNAEVFAEVAAVLTMAPEYPHIVQQMADIRAISSDYESRRVLPGMRPSDASYYDGVSYYLTRALDLVAEHIRSVGMEAVARYSMDDISKVARDITVRGALSKSELHQMATSLAAGAPPSARVKLAKERLLQDTGVAVPPKPTKAQRLLKDDDHYFVDKMLQDIPDVEKQSVREAVKDAASTVIAQGHLGEQGLITLIESWRKKVQEEDDEARAYERKLYVLSLMLTQGHLEKELARETRLERAERVSRERAEEAAKRAVEAAGKPEEAAPAETIPSSTEPSTAIEEIKPPEAEKSADAPASETPPAPEPELPRTRESEPQPLKELEMIDVPAQDAVQTVDITNEGLVQNTSMNNRPAMALTP